jgi:prevent-host-death family protein
MTVTVTQFKTHCLGLFDTLSRSSEEIIVTKRGKPVAKVVPAADATDRSVREGLRGTAHFTCEDLFSGDDIWEA